MSPVKDEDRLLEHDYDGIREYDNPMPRWWLWILIGSVVWAALYWFNVPGIGSGKGRAANYEADMAAARERYGPPPGAVAAPVDADLPRVLFVGVVRFLTITNSGSKPKPVMLRLSEPLPV